MTTPNEDEVGELLAKAWAQVEAAKLPESVQLFAFQEAIRRLSGEQPVVAEAQNYGNTPAAELKARPYSARKDASTSNRGSASPVESSTNLPSMTESEFLDKLSEETGADREQLSHVFVLDSNGAPRVNMRAAELGGTTKERMLTVAQLLVVARMCGFGESEVRVNVISTACTALRCWDGNNFSSYASKLPGFQFISGPNGTSRMRVRTAGEQSFVGLVAKLATRAAETAG
ncbi:hypothetical protein [Kribbella sp. NPDC004875]|uniref:hypothetical protein n=1 Tax=Kribbella sp. NPDC004875 TaxID=3364107 RepID=UPI00367BA667